MTDRRWHGSMTADRWSGFSRDRQILMIASEFGRADSLIRKGMYEEVLCCFERAFELLDLCTADPQWATRLRELLRFREAMGELYLAERPDIKQCRVYHRVLLSWHPKTERVEVEEGEE